MPPSTHIACFYIADFPAIAVQRAEQLNKDVIVVHKLSVISCTAGARARGVEIGDSSQRAERLAPDSVIVLRKYATELSVWEEVLQTVYTTTPHMVELGMGSVLLHATDAHALRLFAEQFQARVGIASAALTAQLAAYSCQPGLLYFVDDSDAKSFLEHSSVELLHYFGVDEEHIERLMLFGLSSLSLLATLNERQCIAQFGKEGKRIKRVVQDLLRNQRAALPYFVPPQPLTARYRFENAVREPRDLVAALRDLVSQTMSELQRTYGRKCCWIGVRLTPRAARTCYARRILKQATDSIDAIRTAAEVVLRKMMNGSECTDISFELGGLLIAQAEQTSFIAEKVEAYAIAEKVEKRYPHSMFKAEVGNADAYLAEDRFSLLPYAIEHSV